MRSWGYKDKADEEVRRASHGDAQVDLGLHPRSLHFGHRLGNRVHLEVRRDELALAVHIGNVIGENSVQHTV